MCCEESCRSGVTTTHPLTCVGTCVCVFVCLRTLSNELPARYDDRRDREEVVQDDTTHLQRIHLLPARTPNESNECCGTQRWKRGKRKEQMCGPLWQVTGHPQPHLEPSPHAQVTHLQKKKKKWKERMKKKEEKALKKSDAAVFSST